MATPADTLIESLLKTKEVPLNERDPILVLIKKNDVKTVGEFIQLQTRIGKYNQLLRIEEELGAVPGFGRR